jgi:hypothetical protein
MYIEAVKWHNMSRPWSLCTSLYALLLLILFLNAHARAFTHTHTHTHTHAQLPWTVWALFLSTLILFASRVLLRPCPNLSSLPPRNRVTLSHRVLLAQRPNSYTIFCAGEKKRSERSPWQSALYRKRSAYSGTSLVADLKLQEVSGSTKMLLECNQ